MDLGVETVNNIGAGKGTVSRLPSKTGSFPNALGIDLSKDVGGGIKAVGKLEMGIDLDSGTSGQGPRLFGRQAYVGIDSASFGALTFGRQYSMLFWGLTAGDLLGPNIYGLGSIDAWVPNARNDNSVAWRGKFGQVSVGALYSFGRETQTGAVPGQASCAGEDAAATSTCTAVSGMVRYDDKDKKFAIAAAIDTQTGGAGTTANFFNGLNTAFTSGSNTDTRSTINGFYKIEKLRIGAGLLNREVKTTASFKQNTTWLQADYPIDKWVLAAGLFNVTTNNQQVGGVDRKANLYALRAIYNFDEQLSAYGTLGMLDNNSAATYGLSGGGAGTGPTVGNDQTGTMFGVRYRF